MDWQEVSRLGYRLASSALLLAAVLAGLALLGILAFAVWILWSERQVVRLTRVFARFKGDQTCRVDCVATDP